ncbi:hypothetical protein BDV34DRAFT_220571 [Aspergillus parasiticus]|uniref:Uncharacterized protein n=1 Tax=Aspergillus parasiticus TaxID=5067 RepID=A0A5N6E0Z0_ASPPA|nr:hypothetical protein BDV34DRAFT_220571 [Aspergillus parasiticus]
MTRIGAAVFACPACNKSFDRRDHLRRHMDSHQNERIWKCSLCQKAYNRRDILTRHYAIHHGTQDAPSRQNTPGKKKRARTNRACESCAASKLKCDDNRPCVRCTQAGRECVDKQADNVMFSTAEATACNAEIQISPTMLGAVEYNDEQSQPQDLGSAEIASSDMMNEWQVPGRESWGYPAYFEQILGPLDSAFSFPDIPTEISAYMQGFATDGSADSPNLLDFTLDLASAVDNDIVAPSNNGNDPELAPIDKMIGSQAEEKERHPWQWVPTSNQKTFMNQSHIAIDGDIVDEAASSPNTAKRRLAANSQVSRAVRDNLLQFISRVTKTEVSISAFPDPNFLEVLVNAGIARRGNREIWIHPGTLSYNSMRLELLTGLTVAGCVEAENHVVRDLQYLQAYMLWVDTGMTCGYPRKMEIAEGRFPQLCTALRRSGAFDRKNYQPIQPTINDDEETLNRKWYKWAEQESFKRLAYYVLELDMQVAMVFNRNPTVSYSEFTAPLPHASEEWFASSAVEWRQAYLERDHGDGQDELSLRDLLLQPTLLNSLPSCLDFSKAISLLLHGLAGQVYEYKKQNIFAGSSQSRRSVTLQLAIRTQQQDLYQTLSGIRNCISFRAPEVTLLLEFLALSLFADLEEIQRFVGKDGVTEARRVYSSLIDWFHSIESRNAVWHAGQVIQAARDIDHFQFRGYETIMIYHATLVLWVYGALSCANIKHSSSGCPPGQRGAFDSLPLSGSPARAKLASHKDIYLDGSMNEDVHRFLEIGDGFPGLKSWNSGPSPQESPSNQQFAFCDLRHSNMVMGIGRKVLERNYPYTPNNQRPLPPLVQRLCNIMNELGELPRIEI